MNKKILITMTVASITTAVTTLATIACVSWKKRNKNINNTQTDNEYSDGIMDTNSFNEVPTSEEEVKRDNADIDQFIAFLIKNGRDIEEVKSVYETITLIRENNPNEYPNVKSKMFELMDREFDLEASLKFDNDNFMLVYGNMNPCNIFIRNGFKILEMGPEHQHEILLLIDALIHLKDKDQSEFATVMCEIYHTFNMLESGKISATAYDEKFKKYVDTYIRTKEVEND